MSESDSWLRRFLGGSRAWVRDARGRRVLLVDVAKLLAGMGAEPGSHDEGRERLAEIHGALVRGVGKQQWVHLALVVSLTLFVWGALLVSVYFALRGATPISGWLTTVGIGLNSLFTVALVFRSVRVVRAAHLASALVGVGCCASCGYDVRQLSAGGDGARTCPECGAAWRLPRAGTTEDEAAEAYRDAVLRGEWFVGAMGRLGRWLRRWRRK